jgi:hypothetical protein
MEIFAIGLDDVPKRSDWIDNPKATKSNREGKRNPDEPAFVARQDLQPHLIEKFAVKRR